MAVHRGSRRARLGVLLSWTHGHAAPEVTGAFVRASELELPPSGSIEELRLLYGLFLGSLFAPDLPRALSHARQLLEAGERSGDARYLLGAHAAMGMVCLHRGEIAVAGQHSGRAAEIADSLDERSMLGVLQADGGSSSRGYQALSLALAGKGPTAESVLFLAIEGAQAAEHPFSIALALMMRAWIRVVLGAVEPALEAGRAALAYATDHSFTVVAGAAMVFQAWAMGRGGEPGAAVGLARRGREELLNMGMGLIEHCLLALQAEVEQQAGLTDAALASLETGLRRVQETGDRFYEAELHRLRGGLLAGSARSQRADAEAELRRAVDVAERQGAVTLMVRAAADLERLLGRAPSPPIVP